MWTDAAVENSNLFSRHAFEQIAQQAQRIACGRCATGMTPEEIKAFSNLEDSCRVILSMIQAGGYQ